MVCLVHQCAPKPRIDPPLCMCDLWPEGMYVRCLEVAVIIADTEDGPKGDKPRELASSEHPSSRGKQIRGQKLDRMNKVKGCE